MRITRHPLLAPVGGLRHIPADEGIIVRLSSSFAEVQQRQGALADGFYARLAQARPDLVRALQADPQGLARHKDALLAALAMVVGNLHDPVEVRRQLQELGRTGHCLAEIAGREPRTAQHVVAAIADLLGEQWSEDLAHEWTRTMELVVAAMLEGMPGSRRHDNRDDPTRSAVHTR